MAIQISQLKGYHFYEKAIFSESIPRKIQLLKLALSEIEQEFDNTSDPIKMVLLYDLKQECKTSIRALEAYKKIQPKKSVSFETTETEDNPKQKKYPVIKELVIARLFRTENEKNSPKKPQELKSIFNSAP